MVSVKMHVDEALESSLILRSARGDRKATEALWAMYSPFIQTLIRRIDPSSGLQDDLYQAGYIGLMSAIRRFDPDYGTRLVTYAYPWIIGEIKKVMRETQKHANTVSIDNQSDRDGYPFVDHIVGESDIDLRRIDIQSALSSLPDDEKLLIILRYYRDKSQVETAILLKKSQSQISRLERRVLDKMGVMLS